ncbi:hypothetical protein ACFQ21_19170 [Ohtaekwangia kribbensis]|uniref:Lipocalin-like domain-containing protein n=1 Tax=Ohtaekwangia kribbensis TaxID=688913 RepID=A0ABW3K811_9BACT
MNIKIILSILFVAAGVSLRAQNITTDNLKWHVSYIDDVNKGERTQSENEKLVTYGSERIEWHNADGSIKYTYAINDIGGSWSNVSNNGSIVYQFKNGDQLGTVTFERANNEITVRVLLGKDDELPVIYEIKIVKITTL